MSAASADIAGASVARVVFDNRVGTSYNADRFRRACPTSRFQLPTPEPAIHQQLSTPDLPPPRFDLHLSSFHLA